MTLRRWRPRLRNSTALLSLAAVLLLAAAPAPAFASVSAPTSPAPSAAPSESSAPQPIPNDSGVPTPPAGKVTFAVVPATRNGPDGRADFSYNRQPAGTVITDYLALSNYGDVEATFNFAAADAYTDSTGHLTIDDQTSSTDIGTWVNFAKTSVTLPPHTRANEPFTVRIPANAKTGDHLGAVYASYAKTAVNPGDLSEQHRVAAPIYVSVGGDVSVGLQVQSLRSEYHKNLNPLSGGSVDVSYVVHNSGNVVLAVTQHISITGIFGITVASTNAPKISDLVPGQSVQFNVTLPHAFPLAWMTTRVELRPTLAFPNSAGPAPSKISAVVKTAGYWATPVLLLIIILVLVGGGWWGWKYYRYRQALRAQYLDQVVKQARREGANQLAGSSASGGGKSRGPGSSNEPADTT